MFTFVKHEYAWSWKKNVPISNLQINKMIQTYADKYSTKVLKNEKEHILNSVQHVSM